VNSLDLAALEEPIMPDAMEPSAYHRQRKPAYRLELLPVVPPFFRKARLKTLSQGELVYYGPMPSYYGIGEVIFVADRHVVVDFRGTGAFGVHEEAMEPQYLLPIPEDRRSLL
jgi:hypothetical protein